MNSKNITAAQQQGQAVAWPGHCTDCLGSTFETTHDNGRICVECKRVYPPQPMQQGGGEVLWLRAQDAADIREGHHVSGAFAEFSLAQDDEFTVPFRTAPPSAPVGVDKATLRQALHAMKRCQRESGGHQWAPWIAKVEASLAQQPAAVDGAMVMVQKHDALILADFAKTHGGAMEQLAARRIASLATQHQEPKT